MAHYEYEFEVLALSAGGYSLFGGVGIRTEGHQEVIRSRAAAGGVMWAICPAFSGPLDILRPSSWYLNAR